MDHVRVGTSHSLLRKVRCWFGSVRVTVMTEPSLIVNGSGSILHPGSLLLTIVVPPCGIAKSVNDGL